jgi:nucleoid-associated protein YgaU
MAIEKAYITILDPLSFGVTDTVRFMYNPKELGFKKSASWESKPAKAAQHTPPPEFQGADPIELSVEIFLDHFETGDDISSTIDRLLGCCVPTPQSVAMKKPSPPWVRFGWGARQPMTAYVESVDVRCTMFDESGRPLRGTCTVTMKEVPTDPSGQNPTSGALAPIGSHVVAEGDTLASIAYDQYADPTAWRLVAQANDIDDPFSLVPGQRLLVPDVAALPSGGAG